MLAADEQADRSRAESTAVGQHTLSCGGTGTGKTTSALRVLAARAVADGSAVLAIDQKGDKQAEEMLRDIAAAAGRMFILIDPRAPDTDRWQPVWGDVGEVVARTVEPIKAGEEYYSDMLRLYLASSRECFTTPVRGRGHCRS